jgi:hypothetical protein
MAGFNVCLLVMGESESGKTFTIQGESTHKAGVVPLILDYLFSKLTGGLWFYSVKSYVIIISKVYISLFDAIIENPLLIMHCLKKRKMRY